MSEGERPPLAWIQDPEQLNKAPCKVVWAHLHVDALERGVRDWEAVAATQRHVCTSSSGLPYVGP